MPNYSGIWTLSQQAQAKAVSNWPSPPLPPIGTAYEGGYFAGQIGVGGVATYNLVVGPIASAQSTLTWKNVNTATAGADSVIDGPQNTLDMVADGNSTVYPSAHFCNDLSTGGQTDWYMPAKNELEVCYFNLKSTTTANNTNSGINSNAVPARASNYAAGTPAQNPAQTSAAAFVITTGAEAFAAAFYWSSTEFSTPNAQAQNFNDGYQSNYTKNYSSFRVRAIRRVAV